jgi:tetratricopeptide (TPR) repeat protein
MQRARDESMDTGRRWRPGWRWVAAVVAIGAGAVILFGLPGDLDARFYRSSLPGARGLLLYLAGDHAGAARAYREDLRRSVHAGEGTGGDPGLVALISGDLASAESRAKDALGRDPASIPARLTLAEVALQRGESREALAVLEPALDRVRAPFDAFLLAAVAHARAGESGTAIDLLNLALRTAEVEERPTSFLQALEVTGELNRQPAASRPACLLAHLHRYLRIFDSSHGRVAVRRAKEAIARGDRPADAYLTIGVVYDKQGYPDHALSALREAVAWDGRHPEALRWAAIQYRRRGDLANDYLMSKRAYEAAPRDPFYVNSFGDVLIERLGDLRQAKTVWERAVRESPDNVFGLAQLGRVERFLGNHTRAIELLETALRHDPSRARIRWELGYALVDAERPDDAVRLFQEWVAQDPRDPIPHSNLAGVYSHARRGREAIAELETAFRLGERSADRYEYLCELYFYETPDLQRSAECFRRLLAWQPGRPRALQLLPEIEKNLAIAAARKR